MNWTCEAPKFLGIPLCCDRTPTGCLVGWLLTAFLFGILFALIVVLFNMIRRSM